MVPTVKILALLADLIPNLYTCFLLCSGYIWMQSELETVGGTNCRNPGLNQLKLLWNPASRGKFDVDTWFCKENNDFFFHSVINSSCYLVVCPSIFLLQFCLKKKICWVFGGASYLVVVVGIKVSSVSVIWISWVKLKKIICIGHSKYLYFFPI